MSSIEVSLLTPTYKMESTPERSIRRAQRPPPPPPPTTSASQTPTHPKSENFVAPTEPNNNVDQTLPSLLSEFQRLFEKFDYESVLNEILDRRMMDCNFATVLWRIFLHCLPRDSSQWVDMLETSRQHYEKLVNTYQIDPYQTSDETSDQKDLNHPLSQDKNSFWAQYFADEELKATISIDVRRTCPDIAFFRNPRMIDLQLRILFTYTRHHETTTTYRQGMHEILGIIVYSIYMESLQVNEYPQSNASMRNLYDPQYLEHDAYAIFEKMMNHLRQFYNHTTNISVMRKSVSMNDTNKVPFQRLNHAHIQTNEIVIRMKSIFERLGHYDRLLYCKLDALNIEPTVYGIRWLRLLFGREIPFGSIPKLWTVIFCFDEGFGFVDYFFIALLIAFGQIIDKQGNIGHSECLQLLMKQNVITNVEPVIRKALALKGRQLQQVPEEAIILPIRQTGEHQVNSVENNQNDTTRSKGLQRVPIAPAPFPRLNRPSIVDSQKSIAPPQANRPIDSSKSNSTSNRPFTSPPSVAHSMLFNTPMDSEMDLWSGRTTRQRYDDNLQLQKCCAQYMNKFIERLQTLICDLEAPNEDELLIQLSGLKQIANVLDGKLTFDSESLQALLSYKREENPIKTNNSDTS